LSDKEYADILFKQKLKLDQQIDSAMSMLKEFGEPGADLELPDLIEIVTDRHTKAAGELRRLKKAVIAAGFDVGYLPDGQIKLMPAWSTIDSKTEKALARIADDDDALKAVDEGFKLRLVQMDVLDADTVRQIALDYGIIKE
jgi:hypothetical protein